jgi:hypothetical protein
MINESWIEKDKKGIAQTGTGARPASYPMSRGLFPRGKVAGAWSWPLTSN